jgi:hypothetical protein
MDPRGSKWKDIVIITVTLFVAKYIHEKGWESDLITYWSNIIELIPHDISN